MIKSILTVCVGNICRSPMAEGLLRSQLPAATVSSAGIAALTGHPAAGHAIDLLGESDIDITAHRARQLTSVMCEQADLILVMEDEHKHVIEQRYPATRGKLFLLGEFGKFNVFDPYRQSRGRFAECLALIERGVADWVGRIQSLS